MKFSVEKPTPIIEEKRFAGLTIGILALQGGVREHAAAVFACGAAAAEVRKAGDLGGIDALIIPGGESTTIGKLMVEYDLMESIRELAAGGLPIFGTCAGMIALARKITEGDQPLLGLIDIEVRRNAFGRQTDSFETDIEIPAIGAPPFPAVFIRAPWIEKAGPGVKELASLEGGGNYGKIILAEEGNILVSAFHPELTEDRRVHEYFLDRVLKARDA